MITRVKLLAYFIVGGLMAYPIEGYWRLLTPGGNGGWVSIHMLPIYGICLLGVGILTSYSWFYNRKMWQQSLLGALMVLVVEYVAGMVLNVWLGLAIWCYLGMPFTDPHGQVTFIFGFFWFLLMPFAIWMEDKITWMYMTANGIEGATWNYTLWQAYRDLLTGR